MKKHLLIVALLISACSDPIGERFSGFDAIGASETWGDWVIIGKFGPDGPFKLVDVKTCEVSEPCSFSHEGQGHTYDKFYGYKLAVLRLESPQGQISHVVLRSNRKFHGVT